MTHAPDIKIKRVTKEFLENELEKSEWQSRLKTIPLRQLRTEPVPPSNQFPKGTVTHYFEMVDTEDTTIALIAKFIGPRGTNVSNREFHPQALMIDGEWCYI